MQIENLIIIFSLINLGFFGGFSHCTGMCGPFVLTQVSSRLEHIKISNFSNFKKLQSLALLPYHFGRITTYAFIGFFCSFLAKNLKNIAFFNNISGFLLVLAAIFFLESFFEKKFLRFSFNNVKILKIFKFYDDFLKNLFKNPQGFNGFLLGIILGFIPCGLLYGAFTLSAAVANPFLAAFAMFLFGVSTFPALFLTASGGYFFFKITNSNFKLISKIVILINSITLFVMGIGLIIN